MSRYAAGTDVSPDRSRGELEKTLARYGATAMAYAWTPGRASYQFDIDTDSGRRRIRFDVAFPTASDSECALTETGRKRTPSAAAAAAEQAEKQRWRALLLVVKAKFEAIASGISTVEDEFLAHTVLPSGRTVGEELTPQIDAAYQAGQIAPLQIEGGRS